MSGERSPEPSEGGASPANQEDDPTPPTASANDLGETTQLETPQAAGELLDRSSSSDGGVDRGAEILRALEVVERDSVAIAESYASLFSSLRLALSEVTSTSLKNMECFSDVIGHLQESALDAATKGNRYINSCLRLNEEMKGMESLAMQLKILKKNVDSLDLAVNRLLA